MSQSYTAVPTDTISVTRDLQLRIARFARSTFVISGTMLLGSIVAELTTQANWHAFVHPSRVVHVLAQLMMTIVWQVCRTERMLGPSVLSGLDASLTIVLGIAWGALGLGIPVDEPVEFSMMLATTYTLLARSVIVPSTYLRTLWISGLAMLPTLLVFIWRGMRFARDYTPQRVQFFLILSGLWCLAAVLTSSQLSHLLFGLRNQIREIGKLGQYTLADKLGEGAMGVVYRADHAFLRRPAAIKLLLPGRASERDLARFEREVQLTSRLAHPNTVSIFDYGRSAEGAFYYVMEFLEGVNLDRLVQSEGAIDPPRAIHILVQACGALAEAHLLGLVHRDIKPANIMLTTRADEPDVVKVVDFGLVKTLDSAPQDASVTHADAIIGTPLYLAPESIISPEKIDGRADLYGLGAVGYFLLSGKHVFDANSVIEMCSKHLSEAPVPPSHKLGRPLPADLEALIMACLAKTPEARPATATQLKAALLACTDAAHYDSAAARAWWQRHAESLPERPKELPGPGHAATMMIDLRHRK